MNVGNVAVEAKPERLDFGPAIELTDLLLLPAQVLIDGRRQLEQLVKTNRRCDQPVDRALSSTAAGTIIDEEHEIDWADGKSRPISFSLIGFDDLEVRSDGSERSWWAGLLPCYETEMNVRRGRVWRPEER